MKLYEEKELADFLYEMYVNFGQHAVIDFVRNRQESGQLPEASWQECEGCETLSPVHEGACLVCGGEV